MIPPACISKPVQVSGENVINNAGLLFLLEIAPTANSAAPPFLRPYVPETGVAVGKGQPRAGRIVTFLLRS